MTSWGLKGGVDANALQFNKVDRNSMLGVAILMVIVYHLFCWVQNPIGTFNIGYTGVDIFLFFSGMGLARSIKNRSVGGFYVRRLKKVYPLFLVTVVMVGVYQYAVRMPDIHVNPFVELAMQASTAYYYVRPAQSLDWYLNSLFLLYALFPLLHKFCVRYGFKVYVYLLLIVMLVYMCFQFAGPTVHWKHDCLLGRLPIFALGIICAYNEFSVRAKWTFSLVLLLLYYPLKELSPFLAGSVLMPFFMMCLAYAFAKMRKSKVLDYLGRHTLELYCAQLLAWYPVAACSNIGTKYVLVLVIQVLGSAFFIVVNKFIQRRIG